MKKLSLLILCFSATALMAQTERQTAANTAPSTITISGRVLSAADSTLLPSAMVMVPPNGKQFAVGDANGSFTIADVPSSVRFVVVSYLGYEMKQVPIEIDGQVAKIGDIYMVQTAEEIKTVVIAGEVPMAVQLGDTTQFNAAAFKVTPDADADGLLAKMPGMIVEDGKVEAQGEEVKKVYVDGKLWMGDDPIATLKNIPADAIESIQMFDEKSEQSRLTGFDDGETQRALNIVTKAKNTKAIIARSEESIGSNIGGDLQKTLYQVNNSFSLFTQKHRFGVSVNTNNVGNSFSGRRPGMADGGASPTGNRKVLNTGLNYSFESEKLKLSSSYTFNRNANSGWSETETNSFRNLEYSHDVNTSQSINRNHNINLRLEWKPNSRHIITFTPSVSFGDGLTDRTASSERIAILDKEFLLKLDSISRSMTNTRSENSSFTLRGEAMWLYRMNDKGTLLSINVNYNLGNNTSMRQPNYIYNDEWDSENEIWVESQTTKENPRNSDSYSDQVNTRLTFMQPFLKHHSIQVNALVNTNWSKNTVEAYKQDELSFTTVPDLRQSMIADRNYLTLGAGMGYKYNKDKYTVNIGAEYQRLDQKRTTTLPYESQTELVFFSFQPLASFRYTMVRGKYLEFRYRGRSILPDIDKMMNFYDISSSGNSITVGNPDLKQGYEHTVSLSYRTANTEKSTNFNMSLNGTARRNFVASQRDYIYADTTLYTYGHDGDPDWAITPRYGASVTRYRNMDGYYSGRINAGYSFPLKAIKSVINLSANYGITRTPAIYSEAIRTGDSIIVGGILRPEYEVSQYNNILVAHSASFRFGVASNISEKVDFNLSSTSSVQVNRNTSRDNNTYFSQNINYTMNLLFPLDFTLTSTVNWRYNKNFGITASSGSDNSYVLFNIGIGKKLFKSKTGEIRITAYDLFNQDRSYEHSVTENYVRDTRSEVLGRYVLARFSYRFNSMRGRNPQSNATSEAATRGQRTEGGRVAIRGGEQGMMPMGESGGYGGQF